MQKITSLLTGLKMLSLECDCVFYRLEHNERGEERKGKHHEIEF